MAADGVEGFGDYRMKKLKKLPHIFSQVLVLPFPSEATVEIEESSGAFTFAYKDQNLVVDDTVEAEVLEIFPGCKKVAVRGVNGFENLEEFETWRYRLPSCAIADHSVAFYRDGVLAVSVPKVTPIAEDESFRDSQISSERVEMHQTDVNCVLQKDSSVPE
eukprot:Gb_25720 [translate_table: standard]